MGYTLETVIAEKLESIIKLAMVNTRMKDFYDLWIILCNHKIKSDGLRTAIKKVFENRNTDVKYPAAFTPAFYEARETQQRWNNFLSAMGKESINLKEVILEISRHLNFLDSTLS